MMSSADEQDIPALLALLDELAEGEPPVIEAPEDPVPEPTCYVCGVPPRIGAELFGDRDDDDQLRGYLCAEHAWARQMSAAVPTEAS